MTDPLPTRVDAFVQSHHVMTLATVGAQGPWAAAVFYAPQRRPDRRSTRTPDRIPGGTPDGTPTGWTMVFLSSPRSRHAVNLAHDARVAVTIQRDVDDWRQITGVQAEGRVERLDGDARDAARALYAERFPFVAVAPARIAEALARVHWYRFVPARLYLIDNRLGFGHRDELDCGDPG